MNEKIRDYIAASFAIHFFIVLISWFIIHNIYYKKYVEPMIEDKVHKEVNENLKKEIIIKTDSILIQSNEIIDYIKNINYAGEGSK